MHLNVDIMMLKKSPITGILSSGEHKIAVI